MAKPVFVKEIGQVVSFPDNATPQQIASYIDRKFKPSAPAEQAAAPGPDQSSLLGRLGYGFATGFTEIPGGIAALGLPAEKAAQTSAGQFSESARKYLQETFGIDPTKDPTAAQQAAEALGSVASFLVPYAGEAKAAALLGAGAKAAQTAGVIRTAAQGATLNSASRAQEIRQQLAAGMDIPEEKQLAAQRLDALIGTMEAAPLKKFFGPIGTLLSKVPATQAPVVERIIQSRIANIAKAGAEEGFQEAASNIASDIMEAGIYNPNVEIGQDLLSTAGTGAFAGSFTEGLIHIAMGRKGGAYRQLQQDLSTERMENSAALRQGRISQAAENLRQSGITGPLDVVPEEIDGLPRYVIKTPEGQAVATFVTQDDAVKAVDLYKNMTGTDVMVREDVTAPEIFPVKINDQQFNNIDEIKAARDKAIAFRSGTEKHITDPALLKKNSAARGVSEDFYTQSVQKNLATQDVGIKKLNDFLSLAEPKVETDTPVVSIPKTTVPEAAPKASEALSTPAVVQEPAPVEEPVSEAPIEPEPQEIAAPEPIAEEPPIGTRSFPTSEIVVEEPAVAEAPVEEPVAVEVPKGIVEEVVPPENAVTTRPDATPEQLTDLQQELFGAPIGIRNMTPEQKATYEAERDKRFPPVPLSLSAGPTRGVEPIRATPRVGTAFGEVNLKPEVKAVQDRINSELNARLRDIAPPTTSLQTQQFIDNANGYLIHGAHSNDGVINIALGIYDPNLSVEDHIKKLMGVLNHETIHAVRSRIRPSEWKILSKAVENTKIPGKKYTYLDKAQAVYTPDLSPDYADPDAVIEEAVAEMYKDWYNKQQAPSNTRGLFNRITEILRRVFRILKSSKYEDVFKSIETGQMRDREIISQADRGTIYSASPVAYDPKTSTSDWETGGFPPRGVSSVNKTGGSPYRISQRRPTAKKLIGKSLLENLIVDVNAMKIEPGQFEHNIEIVKSYPGFKTVNGESPDQTLTRFKKMVVDNLLWLHDTMEPGLRQRAKLWYDGARKITDDLAAKYDLPDTTVAAVLAGLSPQKDWFQNVSLAERLIDIVMTKGDVPFTADMMAYARTRKSLAKYDLILQAMEDVPLNKLGEVDFVSVLARKHNEILAGSYTKDQIKMLNKGDSLLAKSIFVRVFDEMNNSREYSIVTPEGNKGAISKTGSGAPSKVAWGSFTEIGKGIFAIENGRKEDIDEVLGDKHKIRNFYNNIISPKSKDGSVTIDTHAVAAGLLRPLSGNSVEVHHNFGTSVKGMTHRTKNSSKSGIQGMYAIYADAYREAAKLRGVLPREMQSITWEAVRGLYKPTFKAQARNAAAINAVWNQHKNGKISANEARKQILGLADPGAAGINNPFWKNTPSTVIHGVSGPALNTSGVVGVGVRQAAGRSVSGGTVGNAGSTKGSGGVKFSAAPAIESDEFKKWFANSIVRNADGSPKVMYHGTPSSFKEFGKGRSGSISGESGPFFFSGSPKFANQYAESKLYAGGGGETVKSGGRVIPVYLSVQNPFDYENPQQVASLVRKVRELHESGQYPINNKTSKISAEELENKLETLGYDIEDGDWPTIEMPNVQQAMRDLGYDGFYIKESGFKNIAVYSPVQVKSIFNQFEPGTATSKRFSAAPLPTYLEQQNQHIFAPVPNVSFKDMVFDFFGYGQNTVGKTLNTQRGTITISDKTMRNISRRMNVVDRNAYIAHLEKLANEQDNPGQFERMVADDSALAALVWRGRASHVNASMIIKGKLTLNYARPGDLLSATMKVEDDPDSLLNISKILLEPGPVGADGKQKDKREVFKMYATAKRAIGLKADGKPLPAGITDQYIRDTIPFVEQSYPEVAEAYRMYQRFNKNLLTTAVNAGIISQQELADLTKRMDYYGYYREAYQEDIVPTSSNKTASRFNLREYKGSQRGGLINDPLYVMLQNSHFWVDSIAKNIAATKSFNLLRRMDEARLLGTGEKPNRDVGEEDQVMFFMDNGVLKRFAVKDPMLAVALGSDDRIDMGSMMKWLSMPTHILRESVTRDPGFMFANLARDTMSTWITSGESIIPFIDTVKGFTTALKGGASFQELMGRGVVGSYDLGMKDPKDLAATIARRAAPKNIHMITNPQGLINVTQSLWDKMGSLSEASDAATRVAVYEAARAQGMSEAEASLRAIEIMDFSRHGSNQILSVLTKLVPFLNARIQGIDVLYQAAKAGGKFIAGKQQSERDAQIGKRFLVRGGILAVISMALEMLNEDDEDYRGLEDYVKNSNVLIPLKHFGLKGEFIAIPKPFEAGLLFSTFPQQFYKSMQGDATTRENIGLFTSSIASTFGVNPIPQLLLPGIEVLTNHDFYTGLPLIPEGKSRLAPELQYNASTSSLAMLIGKIPVMYNLTSGKFEGISPIVIDNLIGGYGGPLGTYISQAVSIGMETASVGPERLPQDVTRLPIVRRFFIDAESKNPKVVSQAYELFGLADEANRSFSRLRQMGDVEATMAFVEENKDILSYKKYIFKLVDGLNKISARERAIERDGSMTRDEKFAAMKNLRDMKIQIATKVADINKVLGR